MLSNHHCCEILVHSARGSLFFQEPGSPSLYLPGSFLNLSLLNCVTEEWKISCGQCLFFSPLCNVLNNWHQSPQTTSAKRNKCFIEDHMGWWRGLINCTTHHRSVENSILSPLFPSPSAITHLLEKFPLFLRIVQIALYLQTHPQPNTEYPS